MVTAASAVTSFTEANSSVEPVANAPPSPLNPSPLVNTAAAFALLDVFRAAAPIAFELAPAITATAEVVVSIVLRKFFFALI